MFFEIDNVKIYYEIYETGPSIILIHGYGEITYIWSYMVDKLAKHFLVYTLDLKGFGNSDKPINGDYTINSIANLVINFMDNLQIKHIILVCHSFAGKIGISIINKDPKRILGLIILGSAIGEFKIWKSFKILRYKKIGRIIIKIEIASISDKNLLVI